MRESRKGTNLKPVVRPRGPLHFAALQIEREVLDVDVARAAEDAVTQPHHLRKEREQLTREHGESLAGNRRTSPLSETITFVLMTLELYWASALVTSRKSSRNRAKRAR